MSKQRHRTVEVPGLGKAIVRGFPLEKYDRLPGVDEVTADMDADVAINHRSVSRLLEKGLISPRLTPEEITELDAQTKHTLLKAIQEAHPQTRRALHQATRDLEEEG